MSSFAICVKGKCNVPHVRYKMGDSGSRSKKCKTRLRTQRAMKEASDDGELVSIAYKKRDVKCSCPE